MRRIQCTRKACSNLLAGSLIAWCLITLAAPARAQVSGTVLSTGTCRIFQGTGSPEGIVTGRICDEYRQIDGAAGVTLWRKESGIGTSTGWEATVHRGAATTWTALQTFTIAVATGATPATTGAIRLSNNTEVVSRNNVNTADVPMLRTTSGNVVSLGHAFFASEIQGSALTVPPPVTFDEQLDLRTSQAFPGAVTDRGRIYYSSVNGAVFYGAGSSYDFTLKNKDGANVIHNPTGTQNLLLMGNVDITGYVGHPNYASQTTAWRISDAGYADFQYLFSREFRVELFSAEETAVYRSGLRVNRSHSEVGSALLCPAASASTTLWVRDAPMVLNARVFVSGDIVELQVETRSDPDADGDITVDYSICRGVVTAYADGSGVTEGLQSWTFTRSAAPNSGGMTAGTTIPVGTLALDQGILGVSGSIAISAMNGGEGQYAPYVRAQQFINNAGTWEQRVRAQFGQLNGLCDYATSIFGFFAGDCDATNVSVDPVNGFRIRFGTSNRVVIDPSGNASFTGTITAPAGTIGGYVIGSNYIREASDNAGLSSDESVADDVRFYAGDTFVNRNNAEFRVTQLGALFASNATITGTITSSNATITGGSMAVGNLTIDAASGVRLTPITTGGESVAFDSLKCFRWNTTNTLGMCGQDSSTDDYTTLFLTANTARENGQIRISAVRSTNNVLIDATAGNAALGDADLTIQTNGSSEATRIFVSTGELNITNSVSGGIASIRLNDTSGSQYSYLQSWHGGAGSLVNLNNNVRLNTDGSFSTNASFTAWSLRLENRTGADNAILYHVTTGGTVQTAWSVAGGTLGFSLGGHLSYTGGVCTDAAGALYSCASDARLKERVVDYTKGLDVIDRLRAREFSWRWLPREREVGFVAQEVAPVLPSAVKLRHGGLDEELPDGYLTLNDKELIAVLVNSVKQLKQRVEILERSK